MCNWYLLVRGLGIPKVKVLRGCEGDTCSVGMQRLAKRCIYRWDRGAVLHQAMWISEPGCRDVRSDVTVCQRHILIENLPINTSCRFVFNICDD